MIPNLSGLGVVRIALLEFYQKTGNLYKLLETTRRFLEENRHKDRLRGGFDGPREQSGLVQDARADEHVRKMYGIKAEALLAVGDHYYNKKNWVKAGPFYKEARAVDKLCQCYLYSNDYDKLDRLVASLDVGGNEEVIRELAQVCVVRGMCELAVECFIKIQNYEKAISTAMEMNQWDYLINNLFPRVINFLTAGKNLTLNKIKDDVAERIKTSVVSLSLAVKLYNQMERPLGAADLISQRLVRVLEIEPGFRHNLILMKKIYVCVALLNESNRKLERVKSRHRSPSKDRAEKNNSLIQNVPFTKSFASDTLGKTKLDEILRKDLMQVQDPPSSSSPLTDAWRNGEAYHFAILAHNQLYQGYFMGAMITALTLRRYQDVLDKEMLYSLVVLASYSCHHYRVCSDALTTLSNLTTSSHPRDRDGPSFNPQQLANDIFLSGRKSPSDPPYPLTDYTEENSIAGEDYSYCLPCPFCSDLIPLYQIVERILSIGEKNDEMKKKMFSSYPCPACEKSLEVIKGSCLISGKPLIVSLAKTSPNATKNQPFNQTTLLATSSTITSNNTLGDGTFNTLINCGGLWQCRVCKRYAYTEEIQKVYPTGPQAMKCCPLCHTNLMVK